MNEGVKPEMLLNLEKIKVKDANQINWIASFLKKKGSNYKKQYVIVT